MALRSNNVAHRAAVMLSPFVIMAAIVILEYSTVQGIFHRWLIFEESYSQGLLLFLVAIFLFILKFREVRPVVGLYPRWFIPFFLGLAFYVLGAVMVIQAFQQVILLPLLWCTLALFWGWRQAKHFIVSVGVLIFAINIWEIIRLPLQVMAVKVNGFALGLLGIHFYVDDVFVHLPGIGSFEVARGCSGLNYFLVGLSLSFIYGELNNLKWRNRLILGAVGGCLALLANWIRVFVIIYVGYASDMKSPLVSNHTTFGWIVFAISLVPMFWVAKKLEHVDGYPGASKPQSVNDGAPSKATVLAGGVLAIFMVGCAAYLTRPPSDTVYAGDATYDFSPVDLAEWVPTYSKRLYDWQPSVVNSDASSLGTYAKLGSVADKNNADLSLLVALDTYDFQRDGAEVIQWGNWIYDHKKFAVTRRFDVVTKDGIRLSGLELKSRQYDKDIYVAYGYYENGRWEADEIQAKLAQLKGVLRGRRDATRLVLGVTCSSCDAPAALAEIGGKIAERVSVNLDRKY
ncbi:exosortase [Mangrovitalea sediminis]|uniref:exosortase n=1 Tax=Mangrovitalea sediminis TaxID=1982043 RepID=UPI000BE4E28B|nr:exosortase [Mangrovitalea sediminis]